MSGEARAEGTVGSEQHPRVGWSFLAGWIAANLIGWAAGLAVGALLTSVADRTFGLNPDLFLAYATLASLGLSTGVAQAMVMRHHLSKPARWVAATLAGYLLCLLLIAGGHLVGFGGPGIWDDLLLLGLDGLAIGTVQWLVLRRKAREAGLWVLATASGFLCFAWLVLTPASSLGELVVRGTLVGTLAAALPGVALVWLMGQPQPGSRTPVRAAQALLVGNAVFWILLGVWSLGRMAGSAGPTWLLALLMLGNAGVMLCLAWGLVWAPKLFYYLALAVLGLNILLTVTDEFGLVDLIALLIAAVLLALLAATRSSYLPAGRGQEPKST